MVAAASEAEKQKERRGDRLAGSTLGGCRVEGLSCVERAPVSAFQAAAEAGGRNSAMFGFIGSAQDQMWVWILGAGSPQRQVSHPCIFGE